MDPQGQLRNLRDFLLVYNRMTEICFDRCSSNFNYRNLTMDEERCVDSCAGKLIRTNHRLMGTYVQLMPAMVQKRMQEMESKAAEMAKAEAEAAAKAGTSASENPSTAITNTSIQEIPNTSSPAPESFQILSSTNNTSDIKTSSVTNGSAFGETNLHTITNDGKTFTNQSLDGLVTPSPVNTSVSETPTAGGAGQTRS
ncbi:mitochondrial import inner membrane translocase subunit Tim10 B [Danio aesculapii]|uniref:mitochondrial import inner membrane translocase subunit Tim10 B n=1 Tax=Danio aesculapii TaxID=1142201 RepID=UPI0024BF6EAB|nr:mitochondrial import inner membrane translocase subunit Tim10 B [Danio aesculapii]